MSMLIHPGHPILQTRSTEVPIKDIQSEKIRSIVNRMLEVATGGRQDLTKQITVGLAAIQMGIPLRIILVDVGINSKDKKPGDLKVYINPEITEYSGEMEEGKEGCLSVDKRLIGIVSRALNITIKAYDREGNPVTEKLEGFTARIFQHEYDHLEGRRFPDRVGEEGDLHWVEEDQFPEYREKWMAWERCPWGVWESMKNPPLQDANQ